MGCIKCKEKKISKPDDTSKSVSVDRVAAWVIIIWSLLGLYGLYTLIMNVLKYVI